MRLLNFAAAGATAVAMIATTSAIAAQPVRSAAAMPASAVVTGQNFRTATPLKHASYQSDAGSPAIGYVLAAIMAGGIVGGTIWATSDNDKTPPSSPPPSSPG